MTKEKNDGFEEIKSNWFKFEKIGDMVEGTFISSTVKPARDMFPEQSVYELLQVDGSTVNVASSKNFVRNSMKQIKVGQKVRFVYDSDYQTEANKAKGMAPAKTIKVLKGPMDEEYLASLNSFEEVKNDEINVDDIPM